MTSKHLLDASVVLAAVFMEPGAEQADAFFEDGGIHAVNLAEVVKNMRLEATAEETRDTLEALSLDVEETLDTSQAYLIGALLAANRWLSLGDAVCLAVAARFGMTAVTAERRWPDCVWPLGVDAGKPEIVVIR